MNRRIEGHATRAGMAVVVFSVAAILVLASSAHAQDQAQKKANDEANAFDLNSVIDTSEADAQGGAVPNATGALRMTAKDEAEMRKHAREVKKVRLNKIGLARVNEERAKKNLKPLVAGRDVDVAPVGEDLELGAPGGGTPTATDGTVTAPAAGEPAALPSYVNNSNLKYFPPIGNQGKVNSCAQWAGGYYVLTHEMALANNWDAKSGGDYYRMSPSFTYTMVNNGQNIGSHSWWVWEIASVHGVVRKSQFHTTGYTAWCTNPAYYRSALADRIASGYSTIYDVNTQAGMDTLKAHLNNGHVAVYYTYINSWQYKTTANDPGTTADDAFVGKSIAYRVSGNDGGHAMTVVGYNDNIWCDIDGDGVVDSNEKGAFRIANSWGTGWKESGYCWVAYHALRTPNTAVDWDGNKYGIFGYNKIWFPNPLAQPHVPKVVAKVTINHNLRNQVYMKVGTGTVGATSPSSSVTPQILTNDGGALAFSGAAAASQDFTYYLDYSDIAPSLGTAKRWFVQATDSGANNGNLTIKKFELYFTGAGTDQLVGIAANTPKVANGNTQYVWIDWTMGDVQPFVTWTTASQASISESGTLTVTAQLTSAYTQSVTVPFTLSGTATNGTDYTITASPVTIAAGATTGTATITIKSDTVHEMGNETVILTMGTPTNANLGAKTVHTATITDDDNAAPVVNAGPDQTVTLATTTVPWTPGDIATAAWYDAADASTITASGGTVSQWRDKSGNLNHLTSNGDPKTNTRTINGLNVIDFDGAGDELLDSSFSLSTANVTIFSVQKYDRNDVDSMAAWSLERNTDTEGRLHHLAYGSTFGFGGRFPEYSAISYGENTNIELLSYVKSGTSSQKAWNSGTLISEGTTTATTFTTQRLVIGSHYGSGNLDGAVGEYIIVAAALSDSDRQKIEGYLAHKWGLAGSLPAGHPYKSAPPTTTAAVVNLDGTVSDPNGDALTTTWTVVSKPAGSTVTFGNASAVDTTATFNALGTYTLRLTATDTLAQTSDDVVITVIEDSGANTAPVAFAGSATTDQGLPVGMTLNALDADGDPLTYSIVTAPAHGTLAFGVVPDLLYTPDAGFSGSDSFTFKVNDGTVDSNTATVTITVNHVNTPPTIESAPWVDTNPVVLPNTTLAHVVASDVDGDVLAYTWSKVSGPGTATFTPNGTTLSDDTTVSFSAAGSYTLQVSVSDGTDSTTGTVSVTVQSSVTVPWTPAQLTTAAWYDAADAGTIVQSSGVVSQWKDKSPSGRHLSQGTSTARPRTGTRTIGGLNAIEFDGSNDVLLGLRNRTSAITIFGVVLTDAGSGTDANRAWLSSPGGSNPDYWMTAHANSDTQGAVMVDSSAAYVGATASATRGAAHIHAAYSWVAGGANGGVRVDGGAASGSIAAKPNALQQAATELAIGRQKNVAGRFHDGLVGEVIIINARLTEADADFLKIEGYLAHKWNLQANLPANHPYKNAAPTLP